MIVSRSQMAIASNTVFVGETMPGLKHAYGSDDHDDYDYICYDDGDDHYDQNIKVFSPIQDDDDHILPAQDYDDHSVGDEGDCSQNWHDHT